MHKKPDYTTCEETPMQEPIKVHDSRFILAICILCSLFYGLCLIFSTISGIQKHDMETLFICLPTFGGLMLLGIVLGISNVRRVLLLYDSYFSYTPSFGPTRTFSYAEIQSMVKKRERFFLYGYDGTKLAVFESNMRAFPEAVYFLMEKNVHFTS